MNSFPDQTKQPQFFKSFKHLCVTVPIFFLIFHTNLYSSAVAMQFCNIYGGNFLRKYPPHFLPEFQDTYENPSSQQEKNIHNPLDSSINRQWIFLHFPTAALSLSFASWKNLSWHLAHRRLKLQIKLYTK